jgi:hypothetical protein
MDLPELWNTIERVKKEYAMSQQALKNDGVNHDIFVIDAKDLEIILEAADYYYERAQEERC